MAPGAAHRRSERRGQTPRAVAAALALLAAACHGPAPSRQGHGGKAAGTAPAADFPAGAYRVVTTIDAVELPGGSAAEAGRLQRLIGQNPQESTVCLGADEAGSVRPILLGQLVRGQCAEARLDRHGSQISGRYRCTTGKGQTSDIAITGTAAGTTARIAVVATARPPRGAAMTLRETVAIARTGACPSGDP